MQHNIVRSQCPFLSFKSTHYSTIYTYKNKMHNFTICKKDEDEDGNEDKISDEIINNLISLIITYGFMLDTYVAEHHNSFISINELKLYIYITNNKLILNGEPMSLNEICLYIDKRYPKLKDIKETNWKQRIEYLKEMFNE